MLMLTAFNSIIVEIWDMETSSQFEGQVSVEAVIISLPVLSLEQSVLKISQLLEKASIGSDVPILSYQL